MPVPPGFVPPEPVSPVGVVLVLDPSEPLPCDGVVASEVGPLGGVTSELVPPVPVPPELVPAELVLALELLQLIVTFSPLISISRLLQDDIEIVTLDALPDGDCAVPSEVGSLEPISAGGVSVDSVEEESVVDEDESLPVDGVPEVDGVSGALTSGDVVSVVEAVEDGGVSEDELPVDVPASEPASVEPPANSLQLKVAYSPLISNNKLPPGMAITTT